MNITSTIQTQYTTSTPIKKSGEVKYDNEAIPKIEDLLDEEGMKVLDSLLDGMSLLEEEKEGIKLALGFSLGIKNNEVINGKLEIVREDRELDFGTISNKLQKIAREKGQGGFLSQEIKEIANELISYYTSKIQENLNTKDSTIDDFLQDLYSGNSTATTTASAITKENIQNKVSEYAQTLMETRGDTPESKLEVSKLLNEYKKELLQDYKDSLDSATNNTMTLQQEAIIKTLLDENTKEASSLEKLLATTAGTDVAKETNSKYDIWEDSSAFLPFLDDSANNILNDMLSGKTAEETFLIKATMMMNIQHPISIDEQGNVVRGSINNFDISAQSVETRLENYSEQLKNNYKAGGLDTLNLSGITEQLLEEYKGSLEVLDERELQTAIKLDPKQKTNKSYNIDDYKISTLDDKANQLLNDLLIGRSDSEKTNAKMWLSFLLMPNNIAHFDADDATTNHTLVRGDTLNSKLENLVDILKKSSGGSPEFLSLMTELTQRYKG